MRLSTLLFLLVILFDTNSFAQNWSNYVNDRNIADILVDGDNVWVGSQGGLTRTNIVDGEFETFLPANSPIKGGGISEIAKAPDGSIWLGSENAGLFKITNGNWTHFYDGIVSAEYKEISHLQILHNGDVWFFVNRGSNSSTHLLFRIRNNEIKEFGNLPQHQTSFFISNENTLYFVHEATLYEYDTDTEQVTATFHSGNSIIKANEIFGDILPDKFGGLIIPTNQRILKLDNGTITILSSPGAHVNRSFMDDEGNIYFQPPLNDPNGIRLISYDGMAISYLKDEDLLPYPVIDQPIFNAGDTDHGLFATLYNTSSEYTLYRYKNETWYPVKTQITPMLDNYQDDVQADCEGNLWFGSRNGVDVRNVDGSWEHFAIPTNQFTYFRVGSMVTDPACDVWFANNSNSSSPITPGIVRISNGEVSSFFYGNANVGALESTPDGRIYYHAGLEGFGYIENDDIHPIDHQGNLLSVMDMESDSKGNLFLATWQPYVVKYDGTSFTQLGIGKLGSYVFRVFVDNEDFLWVVSDLGIFQYDGVNWISHNDTWPDGTFNGIVQDKKGNYWVSTWNGGLYYWDKQSTQHYTFLNSDLTTNQLREVALDPFGNLIVTQLIGASVLTIPNHGDTYRGTGNVFYDDNKNGLFEAANDIYVPGQKIFNLSSNTWAITNPAGQYTFYGTASGNHEFKHELEIAAESTTSNPQPGTLDSYQSVLPDFGYWKPEHPKVSLVVINEIPVCDRKFQVHLTLQNKNPFDEDGTLTFNFSELLTYETSSIAPSQVSSNQIVFDEMNLSGLEVKNIVLSFIAPGQTDEGILFDFTTYYDTGDSLFAAATSDSLRCSFDPNDKKVEATGPFVRDYSLIKDALRYTIRFQNEGNFKAFDITIIDTLDINLDPSTFELLASSHPVETTITADGIVTFTFRNIDLPHRGEDEAGSQGYVSFTIKPDGDIVSYEKIENKASIYFDFNPPIVTNNTEWNVVDDLTIVDTEDLRSNISFYPNPTHGNIFIHLESNATYDLLNPSGVIVGSGELQTGKNEIDLTCPTGLYYIRVVEETGYTFISKVIKL